MHHLLGHKADSCLFLGCRKMRTDCLLKVRWQQRMLRPDVKENMSPQEQQVRAGARWQLSHCSGSSIVELDVVQYVCSICLVTSYAC